MDNNKHIFSLFSPNISLNFTSSVNMVGELLCIKDAQLWHRIINILRLKSNEPFIVFNSKISITLSLKEKTLDTKNIIYGVVLNIQAVTPLNPKIILCVGLLKKESFESVIYYAGQMGVTEVYPILTGKINRRWWSLHEQARLYKILISACEQAKNFYVPKLHEPVLFSHLENITRQELNILNICLDQEGASASTLVKILSGHSDTSILLAFGPEGGFTEQEKTFLISHSFNFYSLTPTILRTQEAVAVGVGFIRSLLNTK
jgi:16S rRNA (uracil1498-N3)-methyltransferase